MKKRLLILSAIGAATLSSAILLTNNISSFSSSHAEDKPASMSCDYYFNDSNGYQSLHSLNILRLDGGSDLTNVKTWGTVTSTFYNASGTVAQQFIQSTDKYGDVGATCLYNIPNNQVFPVGSVVTVTGTMTLYNGMSEMTNFIVTKDYDVNPCPVESFDIDSSVFSLSSSSQEFKEYQYMGTREVTLTNVSLEAVTSNRQCYATFSDNKTALLFFNSIKNKTDIINKINEARSSSSKVDVKGYLTYYSGSSSLQVLIRDPDDIMIRGKEVESITVTTSNNFYYKQSFTVNDFTVTAHYDDGSDSVVNNAIITNSVDMTTLGNKTVNFSYTYNGKTVYASCNITVVDCIAALRVENPIVNYAIDEDFIVPDVYGESYYYDFADVYDGLIFTGFDNSTDNNGTVNVRYVNEAGNTIYTSYDVYVSAVVALHCENLKVDYEYGEDFVKPTIYADYAKYSQEYINVTDRATCSGYDPYLEGYQDITVSYGGFETTYEICVTKNVTVTYLELSNMTTEYDIGDDFVKPTVIAHYSDYTYENVTNKATYTGYDLSVIGNQTVTVTYLGVSETYGITVKPGSSYYTNEVSISGVGSYSTGNWGSSNGFEYYRAIKSTGNLIGLLPLVNDYVTPLDASLSNINAIKDIDYVEISYYTSSSSGFSSPALWYGEHNALDGSLSFAYSTSPNTVMLDLSSYDVNYISIASGDSTLHIKSLVIYYTNGYTSTGYNYETINANSGQSRIAPTSFSGTYVDGVSYVDVPTSINTSTGEVLSTKRYTYYSYQYIYEHPEYKNAAAITEPEDVCNYFLAFGCAPANFGFRGDKYPVDPLKDGKTLPSKNNVDSLFGDKARCISQFTKTSGYMSVLPYYGSPLYYELDIDTNGLYTTSSRQVGRIVAVSTGYDKYDYGYGEQAVCLYTDDHYATFAEYNNYGGFMPRFNAERHTVDAVWSLPNTL